MEQEENQANLLWQKAWRLQMRGELQEALELYTRSIDLYPTAEAHTFRGWTLSHLGELDQAIQECLQAIELDPGFGNPYNDIGAYLIEQGKMDEAIPWLEQATTAPRYENYCYPWFNLGRVYERKGQDLRALECYRKAVLQQPDFDPAIYAARRVHAHWN